VHRIFLLSPASCVGKRAHLLLRERASFELATRLRSPAGAPVGEAFSFLSGLYFRGKLAYARAFAQPPAQLPGVYVITTCRGLVLPEQPVRIDDLREFAAVDLHAGNARYRTPLARDVAWVAERLGARAEIVLLGSVASAKYVDVLADVLGERLRFPIDFVGRGEMSRGGLMLRCVRARTELAYVPLAGAPRHGARPPKLPRLPRTG
jgi:hypothetical protein